MKTPEEIQTLAETAFQDELIKSNQNVNWIGYGKGIDGISKEKWIELWIKGYTKYQKDTEQDLIKAKISVYNKYTEWNEEVASDARLCIERLNESFKKQTPKSWWNELSEQEQIQIQKDNGIYGHDEGVTVSEIEIFYNKYLQSLNK